MPKIINFSAICRTCLGSENLKPIFRRKKCYKKLSFHIFMVTGITIEINDGLPQNLCKSCNTFINQSIKFRTKCKQNQTKLLGINNKLIIKPNEEKDSTKISQAISDNSEIIGKSALLSEEYSVKLNEYNKSDLINSENIMNNHFDNNIIKSDMKFLSETDFPETIKTEITENRNKDCQIKMKLLDNELKNYDNDNERSYNHNESEYNDSNDVKSGYGIIEYDNESTDEILYTENNSNNEQSNNHKHTNNGKVYNQKQSNNEKSYNHNVLSYNTDSKPSTYMIIGKNNRVTCKICDKDLAFRSYDAHIWTCHPGVDDRKILCGVCGDYVAKGRMKKHVEKHGDRYNCVYCSKKQGSRELLIEHIKSHKTKKRKPYDSSKELKECDVCHKMMQKGSLKLHKKVKHAGLGPVCEHCNKKFSNKFRLMEHLRAKHGYNKFSCKQCEFQTASEVSLKNHERRHTGVKPYLCEVCGAKFHAAYLLTQHKQSHNTDKLYKCIQCPASFKTNNGLHMHKMICHSNKSLSCTICARAFNCTYYLTKHMRSVHRHNAVVT